MSSMRLLTALGQVADEYVAESASPRQGVKPALRWIALAASAAVIALLALPKLLPGPAIDLTGASENVRVSYVRFAPKTTAKAELVWLSEQQLFSEFNTVIFQGTVTDIRNVKISFNDDDVYRALATITADKIYRGAVQPGDLLTILLPCPIGGNRVWVEDTEVIAQLQVGMTGIFMPQVYAEDAFWQQNGATLRLKDVAAYGLPDGMRYAFLDTDKGLLFLRPAYESIASAASLEEIECYIKKMIGPNP